MKVLLHGVLGGSKETAHQRFSPALENLFRIQRVEGFTRVAQPFPSSNGDSLLVYRLHSVFGLPLGVVLDGDEKNLVMLRQGGGEHTTHTHTSEFTQTTEVATFHLLGMHMTMPLSSMKQWRESISPKERI